MTVTKENIKDFTEKYAQICRKNDTLFPSTILEDSTLEMLVIPVSTPFPFKSLSPLFTPYSVKSSFSTVSLDGEKEKAHDFVEFKVIHNAINFIY